MDENDMWKDTALIVNTDHGFLLGEHEWLGKNFPPCYDELVHLPFFIHVPGMAEGGSTNKLCSTVDIGPTLLELFGCNIEKMGEIDGKSLIRVLENHETIHDTVLFGMHGMYTCLSDGEYVFMKANTKEGKDSLFEFTMMPTNIRGFFSRDNLAQTTLYKGGRFTNGLPAMKVPVKLPYDVSEYGDRLYKLTEDENETNNLINENNLQSWSNKLKLALNEIEACEEEYVRLGL